MAYTTINKSADYFDTTLITGNGSTQNITGLGFQPDLIWMKRRNATGHNRLIDAVRGSNKLIQSDLTNVEGTDATYVTSFNSDGWSIGTNTDINASGGTAVGWSWLGANGTSSNTDGSITSTVSANTTSGFSIVSYQGTGVAGTIGHGLGVTPKMIIIKRRTAYAEDWLVYHVSLGATKNLKLNTTATEATSSSPFNDTGPTSTVFSVKNDGTTNSSSSTYIAYCFAEKTGYSKIGSYTGDGASGTNPNVDGPFVYTGFKPQWLLIKHSGGGTAAGEHWNLQDVKRSTYNPSIVMLSPNQSSSDNSTNNNGIDFLSNGFKIRNNDGRLNNSGATYIYMAFGQSLVGSNNVPCTAR